MPHCFCGEKVDRLQDAVQCSVCKQVLHSGCCNIKKCDLELISSSFKCNSCLSKRRSSVSELPIVSAPSLVNSEAACSGIENSKLRVLNKSSKMTFDVLTSEKLSSSESPMNGSYSELSTSGGKLSSSQSSSDKMSNKSSPNAYGVNSKISLEIIFNEIIELKKSNASLHDVVIGLRTENVKLTNTVNELCKFITSSVVTNEKYLSTTTADSSPKRKKKSPNNAIQSTTTAKKLSFADVTSNQFVNSSLSTGNIITAPAVNNNKKNISTHPVNNYEVNKKLKNSDNNSNLSNATTTNNTANVMPVTSSYAQVASQSNANTNVSSIKRINKTNSVVGIKDNDELAVISRKKWLHLSSFKNNVTADNIIAYVVKHTGVSAFHFECYRLIKKDSDASELKFVNFKLGVSAVFYDKVFNAELWNANVKVRPFRFLGTDSSHNAVLAVIDPPA